jgi:hypothetical protein
MSKSSVETRLYNSTDDQSQSWAEKEFISANLGDMEFPRFFGHTKQPSFQKIQPGSYN